MRTRAAGLALALTTLALAGCGGGGGSADSDGFTASQRNTARTVLTSLGQTSIYDPALKISLTQAEPPTQCTVHIEDEDPLTFRMFMTWEPSPEVTELGYDRSWSWLDAGVGKDGVNGGYSFHQGNEQTEKEMKSHYGSAFEKPAAKCLVLQN